MWVNYNPCICAADGRAEEKGEGSNGNNTVNLAFTDIISTVLA